MSIYAGFWGPSRVGPVTVQPFPFSNSSTAARRRAADYARTHVQLDRRAALGWHGASRKSLEYAVVNQGDRSLSSIVVRFRTSHASGARAIDMILRGPFPAGKRVRTVIDVPPSVDRSFFRAVSPVENGHVIGARF